MIWLIDYTDREGRPKRMRAKRIPTNYNWQTIHEVIWNLEAQGFKVTCVTHHNPQVLNHAKEA